VAGVVIGNLLALLINHSGIELPPPPGETENMPLHVMHDPLLMIGAAALIVITLFLASIMPAVRGSRLRIAEALAHV
jgi:putative ABC transport system permease protein